MWRKSLHSFHSSMERWAFDYQHIAYIMIMTHYINFLVDSYDSKHSIQIHMSIGLKPQKMKFMIAIASILPHVGSGGYP